MKATTMSSHPKAYLLFSTTTSSTAAPWQMGVHSPETNLRTIPLIRFRGDGWEQNLSPSLQKEAMVP
jgi:hypothetical protein